MKVALTVCPSFEGGFGVEISDRYEALRGSYHVVKTKGLDTNSHVRLRDQDEIFGRLRTEQELDAVDVDALSGLVGALMVSPPDEEWAFMDGTLIALSIEKGAVRIDLEWNSAADVKWQGINELVEFLADLYSRYRRRRG